MRTAFRLSAILVCAVACSGALTSSDGPDVVEDPVDLAAYVVGSGTAGGTVEVRFENLLDREFAFNPCTRTVERFTDGEWVAHPTELRICAEIAQLIPAEGETVTLTDVPTDARPGTYRLFFELMSERNGTPERFLLGTAGFRVY